MECDGLSLSLVEGRPPVPAVCIYHPAGSEFRLTRPMELSRPACAKRFLCNRRARFNRSRRRRIETAHLPLPFVSRPDYFSGLRDQDLFHSPPGSLEANRRQQSEISVVKK